MAAGAARLMYRADDPCQCAAAQAGSVRYRCLAGRRLEARKAEKVTSLPFLPAHYQAFDFGVTDWHSEDEAFSGVHLSGADRSFAAPLRLPLGRRLRRVGASSTVTLPFAWGTWTSDAATRVLRDEDGVLSTARLIEGTMMAVNITRFLHIDLSILQLPFCAEAPGRSGRFLKSNRFGLPSIGSPIVCARKQSGQIWAQESSLSHLRTITESLSDRIPSRDERSDLG